jgi:serine/threonine protein kinase
MTLGAGTRLGTFEILSPIGAGGMGEVYRARDTRLGREVAVKVLPDAVSGDPEKLARFEREARLLASLNHPNIATLHGLEESDGRKFLVMELVEGQTLSDRLTEGPLSFEEALPLFQHVAYGLEAAHEKGIVHRDLKPSNIKIAPDGKPKILDFGLAKAIAGEAVVQDLSQSPTLTRDATGTGVLLGTAPYMSPEQARGKSVDKKTDIWALNETATR